MGAGIGFGIAAPGGSAATNATNTWTAKQTFSIAPTFPGGAANTEQLGNGAAASAFNSVIIGRNASNAATENNTVVIGDSASADGSVTGGGEATVIGSATIGKCWRSTAVGAKAKVEAVSGTALGLGAWVQAGSSHGIAIGRGAWTSATAPGEINIGFNGGDSAIDVYFECGHDHKYVDYSGTAITRNPSLTPIVIHGFDAHDLTGAPTNDVAGGDLKLAAGRGTGTGAGGAVRIQASPAGGVSNNTKNALVDRLVANATGIGVFGAAPVARPTVTGSRGGNAALASLLTALATLGWITDSTTA